MTFEDIGIILSLALAAIGLVTQFVCVGIYLGKLEGYKELTNFKISELSNKVDKHNNAIERTYKLEKNDEVKEEQIKVINHRIDDLEDKVG